MNGPAEPRVAVITPYYQESDEILRACCESVARQTYPCTHFLVADGLPRPELVLGSAQHFVLPRAHADNGNTPRAIGSLSAMNQGFDAIAYLDADNWYYPDHIESMIKLHEQTGAVVCTASRTIHRLDGSLLYVDKTECDGRKQVDTSCFFLTRPAFQVLPIWATMPRELGPICDLVIWQSLLARGLPQAHHGSRPTVAFRTQYQAHYRSAGEEPPPGTKTGAETTGKAVAWWNGLSDEQRHRWMSYFSAAAPIQGDAGSA